MPKDTEVIHREVKGGTEINGYLKENQSEFPGEPVRILGNTSTEGFGEENTQNSMQEGESRCTLCNIDYTSEDSYLQTKLTPEVNRRTDRRCASATVDFGRDRRSDGSGAT